jgi:hypothetical protein
MLRTIPKIIFKSNSSVSKRVFSISTHKNILTKRFFTSSTDSGGDSSSSSSDSSSSSISSDSSSNISDSNSSSSSWFSSSSSWFSSSTPSATIITDSYESKVSELANEKAEYESLNQDVTKLENIIKHATPEQLIRDDNSTIDSKKEELKQENEKLQNVSADVSILEGILLAMVSGFFFIFYLIK